MAKRKPEDPPAGLPAWMATFSDLMNLLLCFFVMLFSMSSIDANKWDEMAAAMSNSAFSIFNAGSTAIGEGILISNGVSQLNDLDEYISNAGRNADSETDSDNYEKYDSTDWYRQTCRYICVKTYRYRLQVPRRLLSVNSPMHYQIRRYSALLILHHLTAISLLR